MREKVLVLAALLALVSGGSAARGADMQVLEHVLDQWARPHGPQTTSRSFCRYLQMTLITKT